MGKVPLPNGGGHNFPNKYCNLDWSLVLAQSPGICVLSSPVWFELFSAAAPAPDLIPGLWSVEPFIYQYKEFT